MDNKKDHEKQQRLTVYFDGACPLCRREINFYRACNGADEISWVDVSSHKDGLIEQTLTREAALKRFHVKRHDGRLASGAAAFAELWMVLPAFSLAGRILALPGIRHIGDFFYAMFLVVRPLIQKITPR
ncbi:MAG: DUF393 domain-containing protein [Pseudomonadota bacterium]